MAIEIARRDLSREQIDNLIGIINNSGVFAVDEKGYVCVVNVKDRHPHTKMGPRPLGLITNDSA